MYLISRVDYDVRSSEESGDCAGVGMEEPFTSFGDTITTPVDLNEFWKLALERIVKMEF